MKRNLERRFSPFDLLLVLALVAVLVVNIAISGRLPDPGMRKASREAVTATGTGAGKVGDVVVEVTADKSNLYSVKVLEQNETPGIGSLAVEQLPAAMVEANSVAVDSISSATVTSEAIKAAVCAALTEAGFNPADFGYVEPTPAPTPEPTPEPTPKPETAPAEPAGDVQTATGTGTGIDGNVIVEVKADANTIYEVNVLEQNETPGIGSVAVEKLPPSKSSPARWSRQTPSRSTASPARPSRVPPSRPPSPRPSRPWASTPPPTRVRPQSPRATCRPQPAPARVSTAMSSSK